MTQSLESSSTSFSKVLVRREVLALSFGAMIGWGWMLLTGVWVESAGAGGAAVAFILGGIAVIFISLTYAELASAMPKAGGEHVYTHRAFGGRVSFVCTWALLGGYVAVPMFEAAAIPVAIQVLIPNMEAGLLWTLEGSPVYLSLVLIGVVSALVMTTVNYFGIHVAAVFQTIVTAMFFLIGVAFLVATLVNGDSENVGPTFSMGIGGVMAVLIMVPAMLVGFDVIPQSAEEIKLPPAQIGNLLVLSVIAAVLWYILITVAVAFALDGPARESASISTADAGAAVFRSALAGKIMVLGGIAGLLTSWNAFIVGGSRVLYALAHSGMVPSIFGQLHPKHKVPHVAIIMIGIISCIAPLFGRNILIWITGASSFMIVVAYGLVALAFLRLRYAEPEMPRPFRVRWGGAVGVIAALMSLGLFMIYLPGSPSALVWPYQWVMVIVWIGLGMLLYRQGGEALSERKAASA